MKGFVRWYRSRSTGGSFLEQAKILSRAGISLDHPTFRTGVVLDVDGNGVRLSEAEIARLIDIKIAPINVEFWLSPDTNLSCFLSWILLGLEVYDFSLDGLSRDQAENVISILLDQLFRKSVDTAGYVVDLSGKTESYDWNDFFDGIDKGTVASIAMYPDVFGIKSSPAVGAFLSAVPSFIESRPVRSDLTELVPVHGDLA
jgi:hypothetical protein